MYRDYKGIVRNLGNVVYRDYRGIILPYSLLTN